MNQLKDLKRELKQAGNPAQAKHLMRFFKTGKGEYAEGDIFLGIKVPVTRRIVKKYFSLSLVDVKKLLQSPFHEERLAALFILVWRYQHGNEVLKKKIYQLYLANTQYINNWDLVDCSAEHIVGASVRDIRILKKMAGSKLLWDRRIAMIATFYYIKNKSDKEAYTIARLLFNDKHDLIHKAVGWMLREGGKRVSRQNLERFLEKNIVYMSRTTLRYAIEHFSPSERQAYLRR